MMWCWKFCPGQRGKTSNDFISNVPAPAIPCWLLISAFNRSSTGDLDSFPLRYRSPISATFIAHVVVCNVPRTSIDTTCPPYTVVIASCTKKTSLARVAGRDKPMVLVSLGQAAPP